VIDIKVFDRDGQHVASIEGLALQRVDAAAFGPSAARKGWLYRTIWEPGAHANEGTSLTAERLPAPRNVVAHVEAVLDPRNPTYGVPVLEQRFEELEALATGYVVAALEGLGWRPFVGEELAVDGFADRLGILPNHRRFLGRMLEMLAEDGFLVRQPNGWRVDRLPQTRHAELELRLADDPERAAELGLLTRVGRQLAAALRGSVNAVDLLFPDGSLALAERLYEESPLFRAYNAAIEETVAALSAQLPPGRPLRVLEIGAGTGATTARLLRRLQGRALEYTFTDVSAAFLAVARDKFHDYPFVSYRPLDIEQPPRSQGFEEQRYDCIVAANVLHATKKLREALGHAQRLLAPGGLLVLLEGARPLRIGDVIVGLTDGWWRFEDTELRRAHALIPPARWLELFAELGFEDATTFPTQLVEAGPLSHHVVIVARAPQGRRDATCTAAAPVAGCWLILEDERGVGAAVGATLAQRGARVLSVRRGNEFLRDGESRFRLDPADPDHFRRLMRAARELHPAGCAGVVHFWSLDIAEPAADSSEGLRHGQLLGCGAALHLLQALGRDVAAPPALWLVTRGAQAVGEVVASVSAAQAPLWGLGGTIAQEHTDIVCNRLDLDPEAGVDEAEAIGRELLGPGDEERVALRDGVRYVARLVGVTPQRRADAGVPEQLVVEKPGTLDGIGFRPARRRAPERGEVEIAVEAGGLNFRDVLRALGAYPDDGGEPLGVECAGRVTAIGAGVSGLAPGDRVVAIADGGFGTFAVARSELVAPLPAALSMAEGAAVPSAYLTAHYALETLAGLRAGERVLIHSASGGVGLAAVRVAQSVGAQVLATAGSERKRKYLEALGVAGVFDSRSTAFEAQVLHASAGRGVDVVVNSLSGEAIPASLRALGAHGRFIELGRRGIWTAAQVHEAAPGISYHTVNLAETCKRDPARAGALLREVLARLAARALEPLPVTAVPVANAQAAFRYMAQARHVGKIVLTRNALPVDRSNDVSFEPSATYLITGGLASVGLCVAEWMVERGARSVMLMARSAATEPARRAIEKLEQRGASVAVVQGDVSRRSDVGAALDAIPAERPLRGIVHCAGVLDDGVLLHQTWSRFAAVMAPKVDGTWNLHALTRHLPLDFFVSFSSAVSVLGSPGQGSHASACAYQDALAWQRAARGLPALSVNWGPWSDIGSVVRRDVGERLKTKGFAAFSPPEGLLALNTVLREPSIPQLIAARADWRAYLQEARGGQRAHRYFERLDAAEPAPRPAAARPESKNLLTRLREARPGERRKLLQTHVREQVEAVLGFEMDSEIDATHGLRDLGIDSLMSIELRNRLQASVGQPLPSTLAFDYPSIAALTDFLSQRLPAVDGREPAAVAPSEASVAPAELEAIGRLSQAEAEAQLLEELARAEQRNAI
jgi:NADPH:quinone reductase-like Zn-dependent oxidoreductase/SAM-dependent methyltransferase/acyl carrier protein